MSASSMSNIAITCEGPCAAALQTLGAQCRTFKWFFRKECHFAVMHLRKGASSALSHSYNDKDDRYSVSQVFIKMVLDFTVVGIG